MKGETGSGMGCGAAEGEEQGGFGEERGQVEWREKREERRGKHDSRTSDFYLD